jgi:hypothetical protein
VLLQNLVLVFQYRSWGVISLFITAVLKYWSSTVEYARSGAVLPETGSLVELHLFNVLNNNYAFRLPSTSINRTPR